MPELPEVEAARSVLEGALDRDIRSVDDNDDWVCRPHPPGEIARALVGGRLTAALGRARGQASGSTSAESARSEQAETDGGTAR